MELKIKDASEYAKNTDAMIQSDKDRRNNRIEEFINKEIVSAIERSRGYKAIVDVPFDLYPKEQLMEDLNRLLRPKGFKLSSTWDAGGIRDKIEISWGPKEDNITHRKNI